MLLSCEQASERLKLGQQWETACPQKHLESIAQKEHILVSHSEVCSTPLDFVAAGVTCTVFCRAMPQYF